MRDEFLRSLEATMALFGVELAVDVRNKLADYFELVQQHNPMLHLVAPCPAEEFATRHVLESLTLLEHLPLDTKFADVGTGAGLPSIPCLIARDDLTAILIESKEKKRKYLEEAAEKLGIGDRVNIVTQQFEEADAGDASVVTCRALDKFADKLPKLLRWSKGRLKLFFGGNNLEAALTKSKKNFERILMPLSDQRYLFVIEDIESPKV